MFYYLALFVSHALAIAIGIYLGRRRKKQIKIDYTDNYQHTEEIDRVYFIPNGD